MNNPYRRAYSFNFGSDARHYLIRQAVAEQEKTMNYQFTERQLYKLLDETIKLYRENIDVHGQEDLTAQREAVTGTLEGLDAEAELAELGEIGKVTFTPVYDADYSREMQARAADAEAADAHEAKIERNRRAK